MLSEDRLKKLEGEEYLETQREDLAGTLNNSKLQEVKILKITEGQENE